MSAGLKNTNGRRMLMPKDTAARFKREFDEQYGENSLSWFDGGHAQALDAAKKDVKFLLIILLSPEHDDTESFIRGTLLSQEVVDFINDPANNIILWGGNVMDSEAYQVSLEYNCTKFPCSVLACLTPKEGSTRMGIIKRIAGPMPPSRYLASLTSAMDKYKPDLEGVRAERVANDFAHNLRAEQDAAYERSLARDRERARQRREAEEAAAAEERRIREEEEAAERLEQKRQQWRKWRATTVRPEPNASVKDSVRLALNMPEGFGGGRVVRKFSKETTLEELYAFVECYTILSAESSGDDDDEKVAPPEDYTHKYDFRIALVMPRETLTPDATVTLAEKIGRGGNLIVEDIPHDESDDEE
jgi:FAS-associated factor 2